MLRRRQEIARFTSPGALKVATYHGTKRTTDPEVLKQADVVSGDAVRGSGEGGWGVALRSH